ncbi:MAG: hypothetical protein R3E58_19710 [Phycisphaerae bacterium]
MISLLVATLGVANLMMVSVTSRSQQIPRFFVQSAQQSLIAQLVLVEAASYWELLGSLIGVGLRIARGIRGSISQSRGYSESKFRGWFQSDG